MGDHRTPPDLRSQIGAIRDRLDETERRTGRPAYLLPVAVGATYTAAPNDYVTAAAGTFTVTSPDHSPGRIFGVQNTGTGLVTVAAASGRIFGRGIQSGGTPGLASIPLAAGHVVLVSDGADWHVSSGGQDSGWVQVTPTNSWNFTTFPVCYRLGPDGVVRLRGRFTTLGTSGTSAFTIPTGNRPDPGRSASLFFTLASVNDTTHIPPQANFAPAAGTFSIGHAAGITAVNVDGVTWTAES